MNSLFVPVLSGQEESAFAKGFPASTGLGNPLAFVLGLALALGLINTQSLRAATKDHVVAYHPRLLHRGEAGWDRSVVGSFAWRIMKDSPGPNRSPLDPGTDSMYWEFRYAHTGIDYGADFMFNSGEYYTYSAQVLNPIIAAKAMELGWSRDIPASGLPFSSAVYNPTHTADEYYADARTKLIWMLDRAQPIDAFYNVRFGCLAYDWLYNATNSAGLPVLSAADKTLLAQRLIDSADFIKTNYARPSEDELFRGTHAAHYLYVLVGFTLYEPSRAGDPAYAAINARAEGFLADYDTYWEGRILPALRAQGGGVWHGGLGNLNAELDYYHPNDDVLPWHLAPILFLINTALDRDTAEPPYGLLRDGVEFQAHMFKPSGTNVLGSYFELGASSPEVGSRTSWVWPQLMSCRRRFSPQPREQRIGELGGWLRQYKSEGFVSGGSWDMIYHVLWKDKFPNPRRPEAIGFTPVRHFRDLGWVSFRTGFASSNDLAALFIAQNYRWSHMDLPAQNSFVLHYKGPLLTNAARNTFRIGGASQRTNSVFPKVDTGLAAYQPGSPWDVGPGVVAFEDNSTFTYTMGDATRAYDSNRLDRFTRQIVFLKTNQLFVMFDRVATRTPAIEKRWIVDPASTPTAIAADLVRVNNGAGSLWIKRLLPASVTRTLNANGIEEVPTAPGTEDYFLHLFEAVDSSVLRAALVSDAASVTTRSNWFDVRVAGQTLSFSRTGGFLFNSNALPRAVIQAGPPVGVGQPVIFNAGASVDPDGTITSYAWDFEDSYTANGATVSHAFAWPGAYTVALTVTDNLGDTARATVEVNVAAPPPAGPRLTLTRTATNSLLLTWPAPSTGFVLQENTALNSTNWTPAAQTPATQGTNRVLHLNLPAGLRFYRLFRP